MTAANCSIQRCFEQECFLEVPFFQRAYVWNQDNWEQLLNTLSQESSSIFLGRSFFRNGRRTKALAKEIVKIWPLEASV